MENITIGQILAIIVFIVALIEGVSKLVNPSKKLLKSALKEEFEPIKQSIEDIHLEIKENSLNQSKNFLTKCFDDIENGKQYSDTTIERIYECFEDYEAKGGNGFIKKRFEKLKKEGKL